MRASSDLDFRELPSISRLVDELDEKRPGVSLYDIVTKYSCWNVLPRTEAKPPLRTLQFSGGSGDELCCYFTVKSEPDPDRASRMLPYDDRLDIFIKESGSRRLHISCESGRDFGITLVRLFSEQGDAGKFPLLGPHPTERGFVLDRNTHLWWYTADTPEEDRLKITRQLGIFAARAYLVTSINWHKGLLEDQPKDRFAIGIRINCLLNGRPWK